MSWINHAVGKIGISEMEVGPEVTAHYFGNEGVHVLATAMVGLMAERALNNALSPIIPSECGIVGVRQQTYHRGPASIGEKVIATTKITGIEGKFVNYTFEVNTDSDRKLADGDGDSAVIDMNRFAEKMK